MNGNMFDGGFFGKSVPLARPMGQGSLPVIQPGQAAPAQPALGVVPASAHPQQTAMGPQGPVPLGAKKDCPICRG